MYRTIHPINLTNNSTDYPYKYPTPGQCPACKTSIDEKVLSSYSVPKDNGDVYVFILFFCSKCECCFLGVYKYAAYSSSSHKLEMIGLIPKGEQLTLFSENIKLLSPRFIEIFHQSEKAEHWGLSEICGMGYRKALEFLVKDYVIFSNPDIADLIKKKQLSPCIKDHIDSQRIKTLAAASAWIGNDETHYIRQNEEYNVDHLKAFISAMVSFIDSELEFFKAEHLLSKQKR